MVSNKTFTADGTNRFFLSDVIIKSEQYCRIYNYIYDAEGVDGSVDPTSGLYVRVNNLPETADTITLTKWTLVDNIVSFYTAPASGSKVTIEVATTPDELGDVVAGASAVRAEDAAVVAETHRDKAQKWAEENEDVEVEVGLYSAKHHAAKAAASAAAAATFEPTNYYLKTETYSSAELDAGQLDTRYYTEAEVDAALASITDSFAIDEKVSRYAITATTYNADGTLASITYSTGNKSNYTYTTGNLTQVEYTDTDGTTVLLTVGYTYNADGTLATITRT